MVSGSDGQRSFVFSYLLGSFVNTSTTLAHGLRAQVRLLVPGDCSSRQDLIPARIDARERGVRQLQPDRAKLPMRPLAACRRQPFKCQFLQAGGSLRDVEISFRIGRNLVTRSDNARRLDVAHNLQRLAIENVNALATADI
jgi:hypothetical protein